MIIASRAGAAAGIYLCLDSRRAHADNRARPVQGPITIGGRGSCEATMQHILFLGLLLLFGYLVYLVFAPFLVPLAWAVMLTASDWTFASIALSPAQAGRSKRNTVDRLTCSGIVKRVLFLA